MADHNQHHHHLHRPNRITLPPKPKSQFYPQITTTPTPTPSKHRLSISSKQKSNSSFSTFLLLFLSFRSLYSLLPFLRSSPISFSIFPFSFLVSLLSLLLTLTFSFFSNKPLLFNFSCTKPQNKVLLCKAFILALVFLTRFQALMYCGTAAMILAELAGNLAARFVIEGKNRIFGTKVRGFIALASGLCLLSLSWDRVGCFPLSFVNLSRGFSVFPNSGCLRVWQMLLPFVSGFLGCYERVLSNGKELRELGRKKVRLVTLFFTTIVLFVPAVVSMVLFEVEGDSVSLSGLGWPLANTVVFGVLLSENYNEDRVAGLKDFRREYFVTFVCTLVLELFYYPELSLWGLLICGLLLWVSVRELDVNYDYTELGSESKSSGSISSAVMKPIKHILSERKSRKIALFLLINTAYMVVEFMAGFMSNSLGLISDACHMLFDCAALAIGLYASYISRLPANGQFNYGRGRFEVLSGYVNAVFLVLVGALITLESFERILDPQEISTTSLLSVSIGGLVVNIVGLIFFHEEHHHAHGGSGSCSHSHSHSDAHSHTHAHDHDSSECISLVHEHNQELGLNHNSVDHKHHNCKNHLHSDSADPHNHQADQHDHHQHAVNQPDHNHSTHHVDQHNDHHHHVDQHDHHVDKHDHHNYHVDQHNHHVAQHDHHSHNLDQHDHHGHTHSNQHDHHHAQNQTPERKEKHHHHIDHNMQGIFLHVLADTMGSVGVVISTLLIKYKGWLVADPACSIFISVLIVASVIQLLRNSGEILLQRVPRSCEQDIKEALNDVMKLYGVVGIQNMHVWSFTNTDVVGTIHIHVSSGTDKTSVKKQVSRILHESGVKDLTVQIECVNYS